MSASDAPKVYPRWASEESDPAPSTTPTVYDPPEHETSAQWAARVSAEHDVMTARGFAAAMSDLLARREVLERLHEKLTTPYAITPSQYVGLVERVAAIAHGVERANMAPAPTVIDRRQVIVIAGTPVEF